MTASLVANADDLYMQSTWDGIQYSSFLNDLNSWYNASTGTTQAPSPADNLWVSIFQPATLFTVDWLGSGGGSFQVAYLDISSVNNSLFTIAPTGTSQDFSNFIVGDSAHPDYKALNATSDVSLYSNMTLLGGGQTAGTFTVQNTGSLNANWFVIGDTFVPGGQLSVVDGGSVSISGDLSVEPLTATNAIVVSGLSSLSAGSLTTSDQANTVVLLSSGSTVNIGDVNLYGANTGLLDSTGSTATFGNINVQQSSGTLIRADSSTVTAGSLTIDGNAGGTLYDVSNASSVIGGDITVLGGATFVGAVANVRGTGTSLTLGNVTSNSYTDLGSGALFTASDSGSLVVGDVTLNAGAPVAATVFNVSSGANVKAGNVSVWPISAADALIVDNATFQASQFVVSPATATNVTIRNGAQATFGGAGQISSLGIYGDSFNLSVTGGSTITVDRADFQGGAGSSVNIDASTFAGANQGATVNYQSTSTSPASQFNVTDGSTLLNLDVTLNAVAGTITDSMANLTSLRFNSGSVGILNNVTWTDGLLEAGNYAGVGSVTVTNSTLYGITYYAGFNVTGEGHITIGAGTHANGITLEAGVNDTAAPYYYQAGKGVVNVIDGGELWLSNYMALGARKSIYSTTGAQVYNENGSADLNVLNGGRVVVGGAYETWGFSYALDPAVSLTVNKGSSVTIDSTSDMFVGGITTDQVALGELTKGALVIGKNSTLYGSGAINAHLINAGGSIEPGLSPGHLTVNGTYTQNDGSLVLEIGGLGAGQYDQLTATQGFEFHGGKIVLDLYGGYTGAGLGGSSISFLLGNSFDWTGFDFTNGVVNNTGIGLQFGTNGTATFQSVPEPATLVGLGLGLIGILRRRRKA